MKIGWNKALVYDANLVKIPIYCQIFSYINVNVSDFITIFHNGTYCGNSFTRQISSMKIAHIFSVFQLLGLGQVVDRIRRNTGRRNVGKIKRWGSVGQVEFSAVGHCCCCVVWEVAQVGVVGGSGDLMRGGPQSFCPLVLTDCATRMTDQETESCAFSVVTRKSWNNGPRLWSRMWRFSHTSVS